MTYAVDAMTCVSSAGANFYLTEQNAEDETPRAEACLEELKSLNPYCYVEAHAGPVDAGFVEQPNVTGRDLEEGERNGFAAIVVTQLLPKAQLGELNEIARKNNIAFILAFTSGITASLFSDFGVFHCCSDHHSSNRL